MSDRVGVLFVCLGNICRSPLAEGVFRQLVSEAALPDRFEIDSAGTTSYHAGSPPDDRTVTVARRRGLVLEHAARQITEDDVQHYDYIIVMDASNRARVELLAGEAAGTAELRMLREFDPDSDGELDVPDPYFGGDDGFEDVHDMVVRSCRSLLQHIREERGF